MCSFQFHITILKKVNPSTRYGTDLGLYFHADSGQTLVTYRTSYGYFLKHLAQLEKKLPLSSRGT